jgi:hypothetical protein
MPNQSEKPYVFFGSLVDGPNIDLIKTAGLNLSDRDWDQLWGNINPRDLLLECACIEETDVDESDNFPGQSDAFYRYEATSLEKLKSELKESIEAKTSTNNT